MKILIVSYYGLRDALLGAANALRKLGHNVSDFPMFQYAYDSYDKRSDYTDMFVSHVNDTDPDVVLWWFFSIPTSDLEKIWQKTNSKIHLLFCWDDPFIWKDKSMDIKGKCKYYDIVCVTCEETLPDYIANGTKQAYCVWPGYDPEMLIGKDTEEYDCDISICCTNLYINSEFYSDQIIPRKSLLDMIYNDKSIKFKIYGPEFIRLIYPDSYGGLVNYQELSTVFSRSKLNICTHVVGNKRKYINERVILILASKGLLYVDNVSGLGDIIDTTDECVIIDPSDPIKQIHSILDNYDKYIPYKSKGYTRAQKFTWNTWADNISGYLNKYHKILPSTNSLQLFQNCNLNEHILILQAISELSKGEIDKLEVLNSLQLKLSHIDITKIISNYINIQ